MPPSTNDGELEVEDAVAAPNPVLDGVLRLHVKLKGRADRLVLRLYTPAMNRVFGVESGPGIAGWNQAQALLPAGLASGAYFVTVQAGRDEHLSQDRIVKVVLLNH